MVLPPHYCQLPYQTPRPGGPSRRKSGLFYSHPGPILYLGHAPRRLWDKKIKPYLCTYAVSSK